MKILLLGAPRPVHLNRWKDDIAEAGDLLGWDVNHVPARGITTDDVVALAKGCDMLLWARTHGHDPVGDIGAMLRRVEDNGTATVALHLDLYWTIGRREREIGVHPWWSSQYVFTADGGPRPWLDRGVNHFWCPPAMGHRFFGKVRADRRYRHRAVFVGGFVKEIHGDHRTELIRWAGRKWRHGFARYGFGRRALWGAALSSLYASVDVAVGDSAPAPFYWSDRVPCTLGRGGVLAHPNTPGMAELGFDDQTMIPYERFDFVGLGQALDSIRPPRRLQIRDNALTLIRERHMWSHRLEMIAGIVCGS